MKFEEPKKFYARNLDIGFILSLLAIIGCFRLLTFIDIEILTPSPPLIAISVENIPQTRHGKKQKPPPTPPVPIPSDEDDIPEDETIEPIDLKFFAEGDQDGGAGNDLFGFGGDDVTPPRPLAWVVPEYPEIDKDKGIKGKVRMSLEINEEGKVLSVTVIDNETRSKACENAAVAAARASRFLPAKKDGKPVSFWLMHEIYFDLTEN